MAFGLVSALLVSACASSGNRAPVVDRLPARAVEAGVSSDGTYVVKPGDTLYGISLQFGVDWRDLARANNITDPSRLAVGQRLQVQNLTSTVAAAPSDPATDSGVVEVTPIAPAGGARPLPAPEAGSGQAAAPEPQRPAPMNVTQGFIWPHPGAVIQPFRAGTTKGIALDAKVGDPVVASQAGRVVYSGNALRGYGNLVILKHDDNLLTAYAHNRTLLVKEGEPVTKGQKIAEAGQSDSDRPKLHFEVRRQGKPVDPMEYLPPR